MGWWTRFGRALVAAVPFALQAQAGAQATVSMVYRGMCDASAAVALGPEHFIVADDERNVLRVYRRDQAEAVGKVDLVDFLGVPDGKESDLEGSAESGGLVYWISSHGRNKDGEERPGRRRLFAMKAVAGQSPPTLKTVGHAYTGLLKDLLDADSLKPLDLKAAAALAPEAAGGLNIEGLAAAPGKALWIGFRNPIPQGRALIVPIENPREVVLDGKPARIGKPIMLDLGGRGIRSLERVGKSYLVVAGPPADSGDFALFRWSGSPGDAPTRLAVALDDLRPEALYAIPGTKQVQLLSDDGGIEVAGKECKKLSPSERSFRSRVVTP